MFCASADATKVTPLIEHSLIEIFCTAVAFARLFYQLVAVTHLNVAAEASDHAVTFKHGNRVRNTSSSDV